MTSDRILVDTDHSSYYSFSQSDQNLNHLHIIYTVARIIKAISHSFKQILFTTFFVFKIHPLDACWDASSA